MVERRYANVWQKMLLEEAEQKAADARKLAAQGQVADYERMLRGAQAQRLGYDLDGLPGSDGVTQPAPQLDYDVGDGPEMVTNRGEEYHDGEIVVTGQRPGAKPVSGQYPPRTVLAQCDGKVMPGMTGWQNPKQHGVGMGWRTWIMCSDGSGRIGYGHMDPSTTLPEGTPVKKGQPVGRYGNPSNGHSNAPHVHVQQFDARGRLIRPTVGSPLTRSSRSKARFGDRGGMHSGPNYGSTGHQGDDWSEK